MKTKPWLIVFLVLALVLVWVIGSAKAQQAPDTPNAPGTTFTYQGQLNKDGGPYTGSCDFTFTLWDAATNGSQVGVSEPKPATAVANGVFTVQLNETAQFGASAFNGSPRWLDIQVKCASDPSPTDLGRQPITITPYASYALTAGSVANGVVTTGNYADPAWLTSLSVNKLTGVLPIANGGTGSAAQNFVDLSNPQTVGGPKTFTSAPSFAAAGTPFSVTGTNLVTNLNADRLDSHHASDFQQHYQNIVVVAKSGGDYTTVTDALNSITDASDTNPYLIYVAPGVYTERITMKPYVDIRGAGEHLTKITAPATTDASLGTVIGADNAELSFLTAESIGSHSLTYGTAIYNTSSMRLAHVTAIALGSPYSTGVENYANLTTPNGSIHITMEDVTASASINGPGLAIAVDNYTYGTGPGDEMTVTMANLNATASGADTTYGVYNHIRNGKMTVTMSSVNTTASAGTTGNYIYGVYNSSSSPTMMNVITTASGGLRDYGVYNNSSSPTMTNVTATASGGTGPNYGVYNTSSSPTMTNLAATVSGGTGTNYGVYNNTSALVTMTGLSVSASGGSQANGVWNDNSSVVIQNSSITGTNNGIVNASSSGSATYTVKVDNSQISGINSTIYVFNTTAIYNIFVGASEFIGGGAQGPGSNFTYTCILSYKSNYTGLNGSCQ